MSFYYDKNELYSRPHLGVSHCFYCGGCNVGDIVDDVGILDSKITSHPQKPFFNLDELSKHFLHISTYTADVTRLYVAIPYYKKLQSIQLRDTGQLVMQFIIHSCFNFLDFRVSALYFNKKGAQVHSTPNITIPITSSSVGGFKLVDMLDDTRVQDIQMAIVSLIYKGKLAQTYRRIEVSKGAFHPKKIAHANSNKEKTLIDYLKKEEFH